jgi:hypothetical protein
VWPIEALANLLRVMGHDDTIDFVNDQVIRSSRIEARLAFASAVDLDLSF